MKESKVENTVCQYAENEYKAEVRKLKYVGRKGAPDRMLYFRNGRVLFIEFKRPGEKPRPDQERELGKMKKHNVAAHAVDDIDYGKYLVDQYAL